MQESIELIALNSCIIFEFKGTKDLTMLGLWWQKSSGSTLSINTWQTHHVGMTAYQAKLQTKQTLDLALARETLGLGTSPNSIMAKYYQRQIQRA